MFSSNFIKAPKKLSDMEFDNNEDGQNGENVFQPIRSDAHEEDEEEDDEVAKILMRKNTYEYDDQNHNLTVERADKEENSLSTYQDPLYKIDWDERRRVKRRRSRSRMAMIAKRSKKNRQNFAFQHLVRNVDNTENKPCVQTVTVINGGTTPSDDTISEIPTTDGSYNNSQRTKQKAIQSLLHSILGIVNPSLRISSHLISLYALGSFFGMNNFTAVSTIFNALRAVIGDNGGVINNVLQNGANLTHSALGTFTNTYSTIVPASLSVMRSYIK